MAAKKIESIFKLIIKIVEKKEISSYDKEILDEFNCSQRTLERYLIEIEKSFSHIITIKKSHKKYWKLLSVSDVLEEFIKNSDDIATLFYLARDFDPQIFKDLENKTLSQIAKKDENVFIFKNYIMEELASKKAKNYFQILKEAIKNKNLLDISFKLENLEDITNARALRLVFIDNNWYVALVDSNENIVLRRIVFIDSIKVSKRKHKINEKKYIKYLKNIQNALTLFNTPIKRAKIEVDKEVAHYFDKGMKKFLPSQKFIKKKANGNVVFELEYTQDLEILPLIQRFLPYLRILEPLDLRKNFIEKLEKAKKFNEDL
jgi:predicted DNA-binding transcriptional regulator YafY